MKKIIILLSITICANITYAQNTMLDTAKNELYKVNKVFDSSEWVGFDLDITYKSDSAGVTKETDQMSGNYILNKKNMYYQMGSNVYVQTDSFSYNIYPDEKTMLVSKNFIEENSNVFPLRNFIDSMMLYYSSQYTVTCVAIPVDSGEFVKRIRFDKVTQPVISQGGNIPVGGGTLGGNSPAGNVPVVNGTMYNYFYIDYTFGPEQGNFHPIKFEFSYDEEDQSETYDSLGNVLSSVPYIATKKVIMNFGHFGLKLGTKVFDDSQYLYYNRQRKIFETTNEYRDYELTTSGFDNEEEGGERYREVPPNNHD